MTFSFMPSPNSTTFLEIFDAVYILMHRQPLQTIKWEWIKYKQKWQQVSRYFWLQLILLLYFQSIAIEDINPQAPVHFLVIPKKEIRKITDTSDEDEQVCLSFCLFLVHLPFDFYMPVVFKYKVIAVVAS